MTFSTTTINSVKNIQNYVQQCLASQHDPKTSPLSRTPSEEIWRNRKKKGCKFCTGRVNATYTTEHFYLLCAEGKLCADKARLVEEKCLLVRKNVFWSRSSVSRSMLVPTRLVPTSNWAKGEVCQGRCQPQAQVCARPGGCVH